MSKLNKGKYAKELDRTVIHLLSQSNGSEKSITKDNGCEYACRIIIAQGIETEAYFADPYAHGSKVPLKLPMGSPGNTFTSQHILLASFINKSQRTCIKITRDLWENTISKLLKSTIAKIYIKFALAC